MSTLYREEDLEARFEYLVEKYEGKKVLLYGASVFLKNLISRYDFSRMNIVGIADRQFYRGDKFAGWDTYNYADIKDVDHDACLITIFNSLERVEKGFRADGIEFESFVSMDFLQDVENYNYERFLKIITHYQSRPCVTFDDLGGLLGKKVKHYNQKFLPSLLPFANVSSFSQEDRDADAYFILGLKYLDHNYLIAKTAFEKKRELFLLETGFLSSIETWANEYAFPEYKQNIAFTLSNGVHYFDATQQSSLEAMLNDTTVSLSDEQKLRAQNCINKIVESKISKYNSQPIYEPQIGRNGVKKILVVDQSYGDMSVELGLADDTTFERMLACAIEENPDADIIIKTHPDTKTGTRKGYYTGYVAKDNVYLMTEPINPISLIEYVDEVYVCTSQFGFEALMCGKKVHTFGVPFYAGWGLTEDRLICSRRTNKRSLAEVFYLTYINYSRYINPDKNEVCEIEEAIEYLLKMREKYFLSKSTSTDVRCVQPKSLFSHNRLDLVVKYLYAKEILEKPFNDYCKDVYKDLYIRHILMRTMGEEPANADGKYEKISAEDYIKSFESLVESIKLNGFSSEYPIPFDTNTGLPQNGAHRLAAAAALDKEVYISNTEASLTWGYDWFIDNGFGVEDRQRVLKGFVDINAKDCAIFIVWNPLFKYFENIKSILEKDFNIVGDVELDFEDNYVAFTNSLLEIYQLNNIKTGSDVTIREKSKILQASYLSYKVVVVSLKNKERSVSELAKRVKEQIREFFNHIIPKECFCTVHSSDGEEECRYLASVLLSPNNIKHLKLQPEADAHPEFERRIKNLPSFLPSIGIFDPKEVCVVGSGVMTALGVQKDSDSDFIIDPKHRDRLGWDIVYLNDDYDIGISSKTSNRSKDINDEILIYNSEYHFWYRGIKFANLDIIKDRKLFSNRPKDVMHLRQIDLYEKMMGTRNQQKILFERIEAEKERRRVF